MTRSAVTPERLNEAGRKAAAKAVNDLGLPESMGAVLLCTLAHDFPRKKKYEHTSRAPFVWKVVGHEGEKVTSAIISRVLYTQGRPLIPSQLKPVVQIACLPKLLTEKPVLQMFGGLGQVKVEAVAKPLPRDEALNVGVLRARQNASEVLLCAHVKGDRYIAHLPAGHVTQQHLFATKARAMGETKVMEGDASCAVLAVAHWMAERERAAEEKRAMREEVARAYMDVNAWSWDKKRPTKILLLWSHETPTGRVNEISAVNFCKVMRSLGVY